MDHSEDLYRDALGYLSEAEYRVVRREVRWRMRELDRRAYAGRVGVKLRLCLGILVVLLPWVLSPVILGGLRAMGLHGLWIMVPINLGILLGWWLMPRRESGGTGSFREVFRATLLDWKLVPRRCVFCEYDLSGVKCVACPECGERFREGEVAVD